MIKGILFDKDGTLFNFTHTWGAWCERMIRTLCPDNSAQQRELADALGYDPLERQFTPGAPFIGESGDQTIQRLSSLLPHLTSAQIEATGARLLDDLPLAPVTDLPELFGSLQQAGYTLGLATNDHEATARLHLNRLAVTDHFDFICGFDSGFGSKPGPGMINAFCRHTGLESPQVAMVGDSTHDLYAGLAANVGLRVGVLTGPARHDELAAHAHAVVADISCLPDLL
jgi:phosphoglycolate phosphatase